MGYNYGPANQVEPATETDSARFGVVDLAMVESLEGVRGSVPVV